MYKFFKRTLDIVISLIFILITFPFTLIIIIILRFSGEGEILFFQERVGINNKPFKLYKYVTMRKDSMNYGSITYKNDPRILPFGKILRYTKINELPQFINVLIGDMSLVGPRPLFKEGFDLYPENVKSYVYKDNKPGLTGMGSLFFRNEEELLVKLDKDIKTAYREDIMPVKGALELWYRENKNLWLDLKIIILTIVSIFFPHKNKHLSLFKTLPINISRLF